MDVVFRGVTVRAAPGRVMIPRPASEALVEAALAVIGDRPGARVADVGTGTGAIAVALATALPDAAVFATDTNPAAVALARANAWRLGLAGRVTVHRGDLLDPVPPPLDLVVANLPYLPLGEAARHVEVAREPAAAVFASGDGLGPYRRLVAASLEWLAPEGRLAIQYRRRVLVASRDDLDEVIAQLEDALPAAAQAAAAASCPTIAPYATCASTVTTGVRLP